MSEMGEESRSSGGLKVAEQAAEWFARLEGDAATGEDWQAFEAWLASPAHAAAYERLQRLWVELDERAGAIVAALDHAPLRASPPIQPRRRARPRSSGMTRRAWWGLGAAAAASLVVGAVGLTQLSPTFPAATTYQTAKGERRLVTLADGTQVHLNAGSKISVTFGRDARRVEMADAEAAFDVAHDPKRPFLITVGDQQVRVVGTEFNVRHRDAKTALTVRRGVVEVRTGGASEAPARLTRGQQLVHEEGAEGSAVRMVEPDNAFAWKTGQLIYHDQPLTDVAADLSRNFATPVRIDDPRTGQLKFSGVLVVDDQAAVLRRLEAFLPVKAYKTSGAIVLRSRGQSD